MSVNTRSCDLSDMMVLIPEADRLFKAVLGAFWAIGCQIEWRYVASEPLLKNVMLYSNE
jgi:hypothetical protein